MKIKPGMKVKIVSSRHGGQFKIGTIGTVMKDGFNDNCFCVEYKDDWWYYNPEDVRLPIKKIVSRKPALNTRKLFSKAHAAYHKWELRHADVTASEYCFVAGARWAARQLA